MLRSTLRQTTQELLDWLVPSQCLLCGMSTESNPDTTPRTICCDCARPITPQPGPVCASCGAPLGPYASSTGNCPHCRGRRFRFRSVTCLGLYDGTLRDMLLAGKWSMSSANIRTLAKVLTTAKVTELRSLSFDCIIPVPQIWHRRLRRNFNAAALVAAEVGAALKKPVESRVLKRSRGTKLQKRASLSERTAIQQDSFQIRRPQRIQGKRLLLADDVLTTGATCNEAARMLLNAGATECHVVVLARVTST